MDRLRFLQHIGTTPIGTITITTFSSNTIKFAPPSPNFSGTYQDGVKIIRAQRLAVDNIVDVINYGNIEEAGFQIMQLQSQTHIAGEIILDTIQENISFNKNSKDGVILLRFLSC